MPSNTSSSHHRIQKLCLAVAFSLICLFLFNILTVVISAFAEREKGRGEDKKEGRKEGRKDGRKDGEKEGFS